jgi:hypothetical protein
MPGARLRTRRGVSLVPQHFQCWVTIKEIKEGGVQCSL